MQMLMNTQNNLWIMVEELLNYWMSKKKSNKWTGKDKVPNSCVNLRAQEKYNRQWFCLKKTTLSRKGAGGLILLVRMIGFSKLLLKSNLASASCQEYLGVHYRYVHWTKYSFNYLSLNCDQCDCWPMVAKELPAGNLDRSHKRFPVLFSNFHQLHM